MILHCHVYVQPCVVEQGKDDWRQCGLTPLASPQCLSERGVASMPLLAAAACLYQQNRRSPQLANQCCCGQPLPRLDLFRGVACTCTFCVVGDP
jgi:hypothetical protein